MTLLSVADDIVDDLPSVLFLSANISQTFLLLPAPTTDRPPGFLFALVLDVLFCTVISGKLVLLLLFAYC